jgi:hypothetical protein
MSLKFEITGTTERRKSTENVEEDSAEARG